MLPGVAITLSLDPVIFLRLLHNGLRRMSLVLGGLFSQLPNSPWVVGPSSSPHRVVQVAQ